jgi:hypothetical protein
MKTGNLTIQKKNTLSAGLIFLVGLIYYLSNPKPQIHFDYTFRVAENFLRGQIAFLEKPPSWLNEFVPFDGFYYSVFPLGSVLTMLPAALLKVAGIVREMPSAFIIALLAGAICLFLLLISSHYEKTSAKRILLVLSILFGSWMWTNLAMASAWQMALGFAVLGELGAIYFSIYNRKPLLAGIFFALAFGNRTEILLTAPIFIFFICRHQESACLAGLKAEIANLKSEIFNSQTAISVALFCLVPFLLGIATLIYNYVRFHSFTDFGYARIPGVLNEPWYRYGIFSIYYIPQNFKDMLVTPWRIRGEIPFILPGGFGAAVWWSSPFLFLIFRFGARDKILKYAAWTAIIILTTLLWTHGNSGGWQFGYRYAMILLPWIFLILLENSPKKITVLEYVAYGVAFFMNAYATYLFFWTNYI